MMIMPRKSLAYRHVAHVLSFILFIPFCFSFSLDYADKSVIIKVVTTAFWLAVAYIGESG